MTPEQEKKWLEQGNDKYISRYGKQYGSRSDLVFYTQGFKDAKESSHEIHMIDKESMLILYHLLKTKLGEFIDVEKFLDENSEETPEGFKYHAELVDQLKGRDQEIERLKLDVKHGCSICATQPEVTITSLEEQLKERDELIKEAIPWIESWRSAWALSLRNSPAYLKAVEWLEKARKMVGEK